jgi:hypothetical protein
MFENMALNRILEPKTKQLTGEGQLYNNEFQNLCSSPNIIGAESITEDEIDTEDNI